MPYTLIICEKPSAAQRMASALAEGPVNKIPNTQVPSFKITRKGKEIVIAPAVGHLFVLDEKAKDTNWRYPVFDLEWKPIFFNKNNMWSKKYHQNIKALVSGANEFISACDYDVEGSVIAFNILRFICNVKDGKRMKFSTLTQPDLISAYDKATPHLDFEQIEAGLARHYLDFYWGINTSRALTLSLKHAGGYHTLSTGRVQGPTLNILQKREKEIRSFVPKPFWELEVAGLVNEKSVTALHVTGKFWKRPEAEKIFTKCNGKDGTVIQVLRKEYKQNPPHPFDLTTLQREAYKCFGYSPKQTLDTAQALYEQALISYPRTSSQKLPEKIGYKTIIEALKRQGEYAPLCIQLMQKQFLKPNEGAKVDPAHPSIFPTGAHPKGLNTYQFKLYDLIVKRFLATFADPAIRERMKALFEINGERFISEGFRTVVPNWIDFYKPYSKFKEILLPPMKKGEALKSTKLQMHDRETAPPSRFTQATILKEMDKLGLGTKATRSTILHTLYERGYIEDKSIIVTKLGDVVIDTLEKYVDEIISVELTKEFETDMEAIRQGKKKIEETIKGAEKTLGTILSTFKTNEAKIGGELLTGLKQFLKDESTVGKCKCGGDLTIKRSRAGKRFIGCTSYPKCTETFSLPHQGSLKIIPEKCKKCGLGVVSVKRKGKRPWKLCVRCGFVNIRKIPPKPGTATATPGKPATATPGKPTAAPTKTPLTPTKPTVTPEKPTPTTPEKPLTPTKPAPTPSKTKLQKKDFYTTAKKPTTTKKSITTTKPTASTKTTKPTPKTKLQKKDFYKSTKKKAA
jgi:DNA topoisomerase-1